MVREVTVATRQTVLKVPIDGPDRNSGGGCHCYPASPLRPFGDCLNARQPGLAHLSGRRFIAAASGTGSLGIRTPAASSPKGRRSGANRPAFGLSPDPVAFMPFLRIGSVEFQESERLGGSKEDPRDRFPAERQALPLSGSPVPQGAPSRRHGNLQSRPQTKGPERPHALRQI